MIKKILLASAGLIAVAATSAALYLYLNKSPQLFESSIGGVYHIGARQIDPASIKKIESGEIVGFADAYDTQAWLGIPYASPPLGDLRWKAPRSVDAWAGSREALNHGSPCVQFWGQLAGVDGQDGDVVGSEDCLYLNIWAPKAALEPAKKLPVMFWIHGGGNDSGTGNIYQGHHLAGIKDVIVVTINYRVGMLGWFSHEAIRKTAENKEDASGNFGTLDIIAALKWVNRNIAEFGGDPNNVTIFGESAGGRNVYSMLVSPLSAGLFHKAISQSGSPDTTLLTLAEDFDDNKLVSEVSGLKNSSNGLISLILSKKYPSEDKAQIRQRIKTIPAPELVNLLRDTEPEVMMNLASDNSGAKGYIRVARVLRDGYVLPKDSSLSRFSNPDNYHSVPLMLGSNRDEQKLFMSGNPRYVENFLGVFPRPKEPEQYERVSEYVSDNWKAGAVDEPAKRIVNGGGQDVYAYRFDWDESPKNWLVDLPQLIGAAHGLEINFAFGDFEGGVPLGPLVDKGNADGRIALSETMMDYWAGFAHTGSPGRGLSGKQTLWTKWQYNGNNLMLLDTPADGGARMTELRTNVADIKARIPNDNIITDQRERCEAYAVLFLHGYQSSDFFNTDEYRALGCDAYPVGEFRDS